MLKMILLFTIIPLLELSILIKLSHILGSVFAISLVATTGLLGAFLAKKQGSSVINKIKDALAAGLMPADSLIDGLLILIGGILLITPGIMTDLAGFCCIIPLPRKKIKKLTRERFSRLITAGNFQFTTSADQETRTVNVIKDDK